MYNKKTYSRLICLTISCITISSYYKIDFNQDLGTISCIPNSKIIVDYDENSLNKYLNSHELGRFQE